MKSLDISYLYNKRDVYRPGNPLNISNGMEHPGTPQSRSWQPEWPSLEGLMVFMSFASLQTRSSSRNDRPVIDTSWQAQGGNFGPKVIVNGQQHSHQSSKGSNFGSLRSGRPVRAPSAWHLAAACRRQQEGRWSIGQHNSRTGANCERASAQLWAGQILKGGFPRKLQILETRRHFVNLVASCFLRGITYHCSCKWDHPLCREAC